jgi:hypothetical protein
MKTYRTVSIAGCFAAAMLASLQASPASAQVTLGTFARDPMAPLAGAMTERQARNACRAEMRGGKGDTRSGRARKMEICMRGKMNGN